MLRRFLTKLPGNYLSDGDFISCVDEVAWRWWEMYGKKKEEEEEEALILSSQYQTINEHRHPSVVSEAWCKTTNITAKSRKSANNMADNLNNYM